MRQPSQGFYPWVLKLAEILGFTDGTYIGKAKNLWHASQLQETVGRLDHVEDWNTDGKAGMLRHSIHVTNGLILAVEAAKALVRDAAKRHDLPEPRFITDGTVDQPNDSADAQRNELDAVQSGGDPGDHVQPHPRKSRKS